MKFITEFQENIFTPWRLYYISYEKLNQELKRASDKWTDQDEIEFIELLDNELSKAYNFTGTKLAEVDSRIRYCERTIQTNSEAIFNELEDYLTDLLFEINDLLKFARINYRALQRLVEKHDCTTGYHLQEKLAEKLWEKPLDRQRFDESLVYISGLQDMCRNRGKSYPGEPHKIGKETSVFWIHPDNVAEVKSIIMLHLPVHNTKKSDNAVSVIHFDNSAYDSYTAGLQRDDMAENIQIKWHGPRSFDICIEKQTHRENSIDTIKLDLPESKFCDLLSGKYTPNGDANSIQKFIAQNRLEPVLRVFYYRTSFREGTIKISLDTNLAFIRENTSPEYLRRPDIDVDYPFDYLPKNDILRFPYAVLELQSTTSLPAWLVSLIESHLVYEVPHFRKHLHGVSHFYRKRLPLMPWWLSELNSDIRKPRKENSGLSRSHRFKPLIDGHYRRSERLPEHTISRTTNGAHLNPIDHHAIKNDDYSIELSSISQNQSTLCHKQSNDKESNSKGHFVSRKPTDLEAAAGEQQKKPNKIKFDPKVFFSNERTFISWLQFGALLLTVALNLLNFGDDTSRAIGGFFIVMAALVAIYALYRFETRAWMIDKHSTGRFDDLYGPAILCIILVAALVINLYLRLR